jgi:hypothetical protein
VPNISENNKTGYTLGGGYTLGVHFSSHNQENKSKETVWNTSKKFFENENVVFVGVSLIENKSNSFSDKKKKFFHRPPNETYVEYQQNIGLAEQRKRRQNLGENKFIILF